MTATPAVPHEAHESLSPDDDLFIQVNPLQRSWTIDD